MQSKNTIDIQEDFIKADIGDVREIKHCFSLFFKEDSLRVHFKCNVCGTVKSFWKEKVKCGYVCSGCKQRVMIRIPKSYIDEKRKKTTVQQPEE